MVEAVVEFEYVAEQADELSLHVGDIVKNIVKSEGGWWEGEVNNKKGMFPENFVKIIKPEEKSKETEKGLGIKKSAAQRKSVRELADKFKDSNVLLGPMPPSKIKEKKKKCKVVFDYSPENDDELELHVGELIDFIREVEDGWWEGTLRGKTGVFPSNFCEMVEETTDEPSQPPVAADRPGIVNTGQSEDSEPVSEIKGKKVIGVGLGNIFEGGPIKLRKTKGEAKPKTEKPAETKEPVKTTEHSSAAAPPLPATPVPQLTHTPSTEPEVAKRETKENTHKAVVRYSYTAEQPDELSLETGQIVNILDMNLEDDGWWKGELNGKVGVFPDNFVELIAEEPKPKRPTPPSVNTTARAGPTLGHKPPNMNHKVGLYPKLPEKVPAATSEIKKHEVKVETKQEVKHETKHETPHGTKKESESVPINTVTSKKSGPPPVSKKPLSAVRQESSKRAIDSKTESREILPSRENKLKEGKHLEKENQSEEEIMVDTDEDLENLETSGNKLVHLTATRPKAPKKRPPSSFITPGDSDIVSPEEKPAVNVHELTSQLVHTKQEAEKPAPVHHGKHLKDTKHLGHRENEKKHTNSGPPPRPPEPAAGAGGENFHKVIDDLQKEFNKMQKDMVSRSEYQELKTVCDNLRSELDTVKTTYSKKIRELMMEVDEEKKLRLSTQVEIERIKKLIAESHI